MERIITYQITEETAGVTIRDYLRGQGYSHHALTELKKGPHGICLNDADAFPGQFLHPGDRLKIRTVISSSDSVPPAQVPFSIVYEDEDLLVLNKPAGTPVHPSMGNHGNTLANGLAFYYRRQGLPFTCRFISRLDRDTTGLLLAARHGISAAVLSAGLAGKQIRRTYLALAEGHTPPSGTIDLPIGRKPGSIIERCVDRHGASSVTHYRTLKKTGSVSLLSIRLETGRTHQIRVHMAAIGHPLLGDTLYNPGGLPGMSRQALHSACLEFVHPITKEAMRFTAPLPDDMLSLSGI
jgi:23S rRNA pseudouridine1911/1915/1917 synthase